MCCLLFFKGKKNMSQVEAIPKYTSILDVDPKIGAHFLIA